MKLTSLTAILLLSALGAAADVVMVSGTVYDVGKGDFSTDPAVKEKNDSNLCWAAAAANLIQHWQDAYGAAEGAPNGTVTGYTQPSGTQYLAVFDLFRNSFTDEGGCLEMASNWYFNGNDPLDGLEFEEGDEHSELVEGATAAGFYKDRGIDAEAPELPEELTLGELKKVLDTPLSQTGYAVSLSVTHVDGSGGHALTCWGYETDAAGSLCALYITDSDDVQFGAQRVGLKEKDGDILLVTSNDNSYYNEGEDAFKVIEISYFTSETPGAPVSNTLESLENLEDGTIRTAADMSGRQLASPTGLTLGAGSILAASGGEGTSLTLGGEVAEGGERAAGDGLAVKPGAMAALGQAAVSVSGFAGNGLAVGAEAHLRGGSVSVRDNGGTGVAVTISETDSLSYLEIAGNSAVDISGNAGGVSASGVLDLTGNTKLDITGNTAETGAAICATATVFDVGGGGYTTSSAIVTLAENQEVHIAGNTATGSDIVSLQGSTLSVTGNGMVDISGNSVADESDTSAVLHNAGMRLYLTETDYLEADTDVLEIAHNGSVTFAGNSAKYDIYNEGKLFICADKGQSVTFQHGIANSETGTALLGQDASEQLSTGGTYIFADAGKTVTLETVVAGIAEGGSITWDADAENTWLAVNSTVLGDATFSLDGCGLRLSNVEFAYAGTLDIAGGGDDTVTFATATSTKPETAAHLSLRALHAALEDDLTLRDLTMDNATMDTAGHTLTIGTLTGDGTLAGKVVVTDGSSAFTGHYNGATVEMKGGTQALTADRGLSVTGTGGTAKLTVGRNATVTGIATKGANITLDNGGTNTLTLTQNSTMTGGTLALDVSMPNVQAAMTGDTPFSATSGAALKLKGVSIVVNMTDTQGISELTTSSSDLDIVLFQISDNKDSAARSCTLTIVNRELLDKYFTSIRLVQGSIDVLGSRRTNYYGENLTGLSANGTVGVRFACLALSYKAPQYTNPDGDMARVLDALDKCVENNDRAAANRLGAAVAGAGTTAMGAAFASDMERQLRTIRNRMTTMGASAGTGHKNPPRFQAKTHAWVNAEGDYRTADASGTQSGYTLNSRGGTVGVDIDLTPHLTIGLALTAMYGDLKADSAEARADGDLDSCYVSLFARYAAKAWAHTFAASLGMADISMNRTIACGGEGAYTTTGDTSGVAFGLLYEAGYMIPMDKESTICLQPVANVSYKHTAVDGYRESGSDAALTVGNQTLDSITFGLGARFLSSIGKTVFNRTAPLELRALAKLDAGDRSSETVVSLPGVPGAIGKVKSAKADVFGIELGAGLTIPLGAESGSIFIDASTELRGSYTNVNSAVGYRFNF